MMTNEEAIKRITEFGLYHAIGDLPHSAKTVEAFKMAIEALKQPVSEHERKTGRWINAYPDIEPNPMFMYGICSECGFEQSISDKLNYCQNCGMRMEIKG